jgi:hypothetical protein
MKSVVRIGDFALLKGAQAIVEFTGEPVDVLNSTDKAVRKGDFEFAYWGKNNLLPNEVLKMVSENHIKPQLLETERDFLLGSRVGIFKRRVEIVEGQGSKIILEPTSNAQMEDFFEAVEGDKFMRSSANNLVYFGNGMGYFDLDSSAKIAEMQSLDFNMVRAEKMDRGRIRNYFIHPNWAKVKTSEIQTFPAFDRMNPTKYGNFVYHLRDQKPGQPYYDYPSWWGTRAWTGVSNLIPLFHTSGLKNGYNIKYHIKIPIDYFDQFGNEDEQQKAENELLENMNEFLSGVENVDKAFVSKYGTTIDGKPQQGFVIEPVDNKMSDEAYSIINNQSNIAHTSGHGIDPSLAGIDTGGKFGGSGSEKRISYQLHIALRTPNKRAILLEPFNKVAKSIMGFPRDLFFGIEDVNIVTLAENPNGQEKTANPSM